MDAHAKRLTRAVQDMEASRHVRDVAIRGLHRRGMPVPQIAELADMTRQRVYQIVRSP